MNQKVRISIIALIAIFTLSIVLLIPGALFAQENTEENEEETTETTVPDITEEILLETTYSKLNAKAGETYEFKFDATYNGDEDAEFEIITEVPEGWYAAVAPSYEDKELVSVKLKPAGKESFKVVVAQPVLKDLKKPGDYEIKVTFKNEDLKLSEEIIFTARITAVYELDLTAKYGALSTSATAGKNNPFIIVLNNTGSDVIENITFKSDAPQKWIVKFSPEKIDSLKADETKDIEVQITPPDKTIAGDYMLNFSVNSEDASNEMEVRVTVTTPTIWGWLGIAIIVIVVIGVIVIFARLGRR